MFRRIFLASLIFSFSGAALAADAPPPTTLEAPCQKDVNFDCLLIETLSLIITKTMTTEAQGLHLADISVLTARYGDDELRKDALQKYDELPRNLERAETKTTPPISRENHFAAYRAQVLFSLGHYEEGLSLLKALQTKEARFDQNFLPQFLAVETLVQAGKLDDAIRLVKDTGHLKFKAVPNAVTPKTDGSERPDGKPAEQLIEALLVAGRVKDAEEFYNYLGEDDLFMTDPHELGTLFARYYEKDAAPESKEKQKRFCTAVAEQLTWPENLKPQDGKHGRNFEYERLLISLKDGYCFQNNPKLLENLDLEISPVSPEIRKDMTDLKAGTVTPTEKRPLPPSPDMKTGLADCVTKGTRDHNYYVPCMSRLLEQEALVMKAKKASEFDEKYPPFGQ
jgi:hypothetical protein